jgi:hypothetical protein
MASTPACFIEFEQHDVGVLLCLALDLGQPKDTRLAALYELRERYIADRADDIAELMRSHEQRSLWSAS